MKDEACVKFLQWALPQLEMRWAGFRKVRRQVCKRIERRVRELQLADVESYRVYLQTHDEEWSVLDRCCRISISRFYRDRGVFDCLRDEVLPMLARQTRARGDSTLCCWSVGCASGEEVYTLSIIWELCVRCRFPAVTLRVIGTDSDGNMVDRAHRGRYRSSGLKDLPRDWLSIAFAQRDGMFSVKTKFRDNVDFRRQDIRKEAPSDQFDLILCRHLAFTYFDEHLQCETLDRLLGRLRSGGVLVTGKQEPIPRLPTQLKAYGRHMGMYRKGDHPPHLPARAKH